MNQPLPRTVWIQLDSGFAGVCGPTPQALAEAELVRACGYHAALLNLGGLKSASEKDLITHCRQVAEVLPLVGFYLQPAAGGRVLSYSFWRRLAEIDALVAVKIAPFNRYQTLDVVRAIVAARRDDVALYTGNDDNIVLDLLIPFRFQNRDGRRSGLVAQVHSNAGSDRRRARTRAG